MQCLVYWHSSLGRALGKVATQIEKETEGTPASCVLPPPATRGTVTKPGGYLQLSFGCGWDVLTPFKCLDSHWIPEFALGSNDKKGNNSEGVICLSGKRQSVTSFSEASSEDHPMAPPVSQALIPDLASMSYCLEME